MIQKKKNDREIKNYYNKNLYIIKNEESPINVNELDNNNNIDKNNNNDEEPNKIKSNDLIDNDITGSNILLKKKNM